MYQNSLNFFSKYEKYILITYMGVIYWKVKKKNKELKETERSCDFFY